MIVQLSKNFSLAELVYSDTALRDGIENVPDVLSVKNLTSLCLHVLQPLRDHYKKSIHVNSGYRCTELNTAIGGSKHSQHMKGQAADFRIDGVSPLDICRFLKNSDIEFDQAIEEGTWTHVSWSEDPRKEMLTAKFDKNGKATYTRGLS